MEAFNKAIAEHTAPLEKLEKDFAAYAKDLAGKLAPGLDFEKPKGAAGMLALGLPAPGGLPPSDDKPLIDPLKLHPQNFYVLTQAAKKLIAAITTAGAITYDVRPSRRCRARRPVRTSCACTTSSTHQALSAMPCAWNQKLGCSKSLRK